MISIKTKAIRIIDYENEMIYSRDIPDTFDEYVNDLISHINTNIKIRDYKTRSPNTEVIGCIKQVLMHSDNDEEVRECIDNIANRLLLKEIETQRVLDRLNLRVQKGSLIQALLYDEERNIHLYLLAKVEHSDFVDDADFTFKSGFSKDKETIWKTCLVEVPDIDADCYFSKIYTNHSAKYWSNDFLEFDEVSTDNRNTSYAFKSTDATLTRNLRADHPQDYIILRNSFISYFRKNSHLDFCEMVNSILDDYVPQSASPEKMSELKNKLIELPAKKNFDYHFTCVPSEINARIKKIYDVTNGIKLTITDEINDLTNTITAYRDSTGTHYLKIKTTNEATYQLFNNCRDITEN